MNSILLSGLSNSTSSGLDTSTGAKKAGIGASFAHLLQQQSDHIDGDLVSWLQSLDLDPAALLADLQDTGIDPKTLWADIKASNFDPKALLDHFNDASPANDLSDWLHNSKLGVALTQRLEQRLPSAQAQSQDTPIDISNDNALAFIQSTLFIAQESASLRTGASHLAGVNERTLGQDALQRIGQLGTARSDSGLTLDHLKDQLRSISNTPLAQRSEPLEVGRFVANPNFQANTLAETTVSFAAINLANSPTVHPALTSAPNYTAQLATPVQHTQWSSDLGRVMVTLSQQAQQLGPQNAEIRLDPPELGPLRIVLSVVDNVAHATIYAAHAQTRLTVEQALPQLQQQLAQSGLSLGDTNVSDQGFTGQSDTNASSQHANASTTFSLNGTGQSTEDGPIVKSNTDAKRMAPDAIIDTFA